MVKVILEKYSLHILLTVLITVSSCDSEPPNCINPSVVADPPYEDPIWHPSGNIIGFNHRPISKVILESGGNGCMPIPVDFEYKEDSIGFWLINIDGTNKRRSLPYKLQTPVWSPDGGWIAFVKNAQIFKMPFDGEAFDTTKIEQLTFEGRNFFPSWSYDGNWIAFDSDYDSQTGLKFIWKMKQDGTSKTRLAFTPQQGETRAPSWGKDYSILHLRYVTEVDNGSPEVYLMDSTGSRVARLTYNSNSEHGPKYSPEGKIIGFVSTSINEEGTRLFTIDLQGNDIKKLASVAINNFSWSPNGLKIVYQKDQGLLSNQSDGTLWIMNFDGTNSKQLTFNSFITLKN